MMCAIRAGRHSPEARHLPIAAWPPADRLAWQRATARGRDALEENGSASDLRAASRKGLLQIWGRYLRFLDLRGNLDHEAEPASRVTPELVGDWLEWLKQRQIATSTHRSLIDLSRVLSHLAPGHDWSWVRRHPERPTPREIRAAKRPIEVFDPWQLLAALQARVRELEDGPRCFGTAREMRDLVIVAVGLMTGLRSSNLVSPALGRHVEERDGRYYLYFPFAETKTDVAVNLRLEEPAASLLRRYLTEWRPLLIADRPDTKVVWVKRSGEGMAPIAVYHVFRRVTLRLIGRPIRPHLVRHTMATELLTQDPTDLRRAGAALTHRGSRSINQTYDRSGNEGAFRYWNALRKARRG